MEFLNDLKIIQGGMGVYVSTWRLARAAAMQRPGVVAGTVSGTALDVVYVRMLQLGDPGGHIRCALKAFDKKFKVQIGRRILERYYIDGGKSAGEKFKYGPKQSVTFENLGKTSPNPGKAPNPTSLFVDDDLVELLIATSFAEVWLAKRGHSGRIFINFLKKVKVPLLYSMYGAMLAGVDGIIVGAGNPEGLPADCDRLAQHVSVDIDIQLLYRQSGETFYLHFDPRKVADGKLATVPIKRPAFLAIVSLETLARALSKSPTLPPDGLIIEHHTAGGHNAPPRGALQQDDLGQPIYSALDEPDLNAIREEGLPFWLAGGYNSGEKLNGAIRSGATGVQVGTSFALAQESGLDPAYKLAIFNALKEGIPDEDLVRTTLFSPTGFPFKVAQLKGTLADESVYAHRQRKCDLGFLQQRGFSKPDDAGSRRLFQRCPAGPLADYFNKRGLPFNADGKRCLCNGLLAGVGLGQALSTGGGEPVIITLGNDLEGVRRLSRHGQVRYFASDVVHDILGAE